MKRKSLVIAGLLAANALLAAGTAQAISGGTPAPDNTYGFMAHLDDGDHACSGALIAPRWVITARSCFQPSQTGAPARPITVVLNRTALSGTGGLVLHVTKLVPQPDRDVTLAQLQIPISDVPPVPVATTAAQANETLTFAGYGRTTDNVVADRFTTADFTTTTSTTTTFAATNPNSDTCKGDAGGPALRKTGTTVQLVGIHSLSWQHGCIDVTETRQGSVEARLDGLADWIKQTTWVTPTGRITGTGEFARRCVTNDAENIDPGTPIDLYDCPSAPPATGWGTVDAQWTVEQNGDIRTVPKCLDFDNGAVGAQIRLHTCNDKPSQQFGVGVNSLIKAGDKCMVTKKDLYPPDFTDAWVQQCNDPAYVMLDYWDNHTIRSHVSGDQNCMTLGLSLATEGGWVRYNQCDSTVAQQWDATAHSTSTIRTTSQCVRVDAATHTKLELGSCGTGEWAIADDGTVKHRPDGKCMAIPAGFPQTGNQLVLAPCDGSARQHWHIPA
jgi:V8-like Glu-specific endopeptidase